MFKEVGKWFLPPALLKLVDRGSKKGVGEITTKAGSSGFCLESITQGTLRKIGKGVFDPSYT